MTVLDCCFIPKCSERTKSRFFIESVTQASGAADAARAAFVSKCMSYLAAPAQYLQNWSTAVTTDADVTEKSVTPPAQYARQVMRCLRILQTYTEGVDRRLRSQGYTGLRSHGQAKQQHTISPAATPTSAAAAAAVTAANTVANSRTGKIK
eukprot:15846-Heterococcus_DN1.PRE.1